MSEPNAIARLFAGLRRAFGGDAETACDECEQVAALIWRERSGTAEILLVTSRGTGRWIMPKGWVEPGEEQRGAAAREAWEEAGAKGQMTDTRPVGQYRYDKLDADGGSANIGVCVHAMALTKLADNWPERGERERQWMNCAEAADNVDEPELKAIITAFATGWKKLAA